MAVAAAFLILAVGGTAVWSMYRGGRARWAREEAIPQIAPLVEQDDYVAAYALAVQVQRVIPNDALLAGLWEDITVTGSIETTPEGARIYSKSYDAVDGEWERLGKSPLTDVRLPRGIFRWRVEKEGFVTREIARRSPNGVMTVALSTNADLPSGMQLVPAGSLRVPLNGFAPTDNVELGAFWIDEHEVANTECKEFVDNGGYEKPEYWKHDFVKGRPSSLLGRSDGGASRHDRSSGSGDVGAWRFSRGSGILPRVGSHLVRGGRLRGVPRGESPPLPLEQGGPFGAEMFNPSAPLSSL